MLTLAFFFLRTTPVALLVTRGCLTELEEEEEGGATAVDEEGDAPIVVAMGIEEWEE